MRALVETVEVDGALLRFRTLAPAGRSRDTFAPTLVLLPGLGSSHRSLRRLQAVLSRSHRTVVADLPGFSGVPADRFRRTAELAVLLAEGLRRIDVVECVPIGHGWGAQLAVELSRRAPELVASVGMIAPVTDDRRRGLVRQFVDLARDLSREPVGLGFRVSVELARNLVASLPLVPGAVRYPLFKHVAELRVPVLIVRGHHDPMSGHDWTRRLAGVAEEAALIEIPGSHHVQDEQAAPLAAIVEEFLRVQTIGRIV